MDPHLAAQLVVLAMVILSFCALLTVVVMSTHRMLKSKKSAGFWTLVFMFEALLYAAYLLLLQVPALIFVFL